MKYQQVIDLLTETKQKISALLTDKNDEHHRLKLEADLQRDITYLSLLTNTQATNGQMDAPTFGPAKTIAGKPIPTKEQVNREQLEPNEEKVQVLRNKVEAAYNTFLTTESLVILREYEENVIRGVAKKAKMKVTREEPETITLAFVEEIKQNIIEMQHRDQKNQELKDSATSNITDGSAAISTTDGNTDQQTQPQQTTEQQPTEGTDANQEQNIEPGISNPSDPEVQQGTQADVNDKGAAASEELPSESEIREATTNTPDVAKTSNQRNRRNNQQS